MAEPILCIVRIPCPPGQLEQMEATNPDVVDALGRTAQRYIQCHQRVIGDDVVLEIDRYDTQEDLEAFMREAAPVLERYDELLGVASEPRVYRIVDEWKPMSDDLF